MALAFMVRDCILSVLSVLFLSLSLFLSVRSSPCLHANVGLLRDGWADEGRPVLE